MRKSKRLLLVNFLRVAFLLVFIWPTYSLAQTEVLTQKWEYSFLTFSAGAMGFYYLNFPNKGYTGKDLDELGEKFLGRKINENESVPGSIFNGLGSQGWELVAVLDDGKNLSTRQFFKRLMQ